MPIFASLALVLDSIILSPIYGMYIGYGLGDCSTNNFLTKHQYLPTLNSCPNHPPNVLPITPGIEGLVSLVLITVMLKSELSLVKILVFMP